PRCGEANMGSQAAVFRGLSDSEAEGAVQGSEMFSRRRMLEMTGAGGLAFAAGTGRAWAQGRVIQPQQATAPVPPGPYPRIERFDPGLDSLLTGEPVHILATDLGPGLEGPLWWKEGGYLLFCQ